MSALAPAPEVGGRVRRLRKIAARRLRLLARDRWSDLLSRFPLAWFDELREGFQRAPAGSLAWRRRRRLLLGLRYRPLRDGPAVFAIQQGAPWLLVNDGSLISRCLYWLGDAGYEPEVARWWARCCAGARGIVEIGSNIGYLTLRGASAAPAGAPYTACEPNPEALRSLRRNLALNDLGRVRVVEAAVVGKAHGATAALCVSALDTYAASAGAHLAQVAAPVADERTIEVPVVEVGELLEGIDAIKVDAEGAEFEILSTARDALARMRTVVLVEVLDGSRDLRVFLADFARAEDYRILVIGHELMEIPPERLPGLALWRTYRSRDVLVVPTERAARLGIRA